MGFASHSDILKSAAKPTSAGARSVALWLGIVLMRDTSQRA